MRYHIWHVGKKSHCCKILKISLMENGWRALNSKEWAKITNLYNICIRYETCARCTVKPVNNMWLNVVPTRGLVYWEVCTFATERAIGVLIVIMDSTLQQEKRYRYQEKMFLKVYKTINFVIPSVPDVKGMLYFCLSVYILKDLKRAQVRKRRISPVLYQIF